MKWISKMVRGVLCLGVAAIQGVALYAQLTLPDNFYVAAGEALSIHGGLPIRAGQGADSLPMNAYSAAGNHYKVSLTLPYGVPVKDVQVQVVDREMVVPGGNAFGIKMFTQGVLVVGLSDITQNGVLKRPAKDAGIEVGDILLSINGKSVSSNEDVGAIVSASNGRTLEVAMERAGKPMVKALTPVKSDDGAYRGGLWVRDSSAGIGTMTYYNPSESTFAGLGHAICDIDTGSIMPLHSGEIVDVSILGVSRGGVGEPGELKGTFLSSTTGELRVNSPEGVFGIGTMPDSTAEPVPLALNHEVQVGTAVIRCTVEGKEIAEYQVFIEKINMGEEISTKNMVIKVTDPSLIEKTGGIVQGMSGSPILQNGKLVGAVTHVFVNDPLQGYGIFAQNMAQQEKSVA